MKTVLLLALVMLTACATPDPEYLADCEYYGWENC
jgi:hypothetical protein